MHITYDPQADAAYITLGDTPIPAGEVARTVHSIQAPNGGEIALDFDAAGHLLGIEVLTASRTLAEHLLDAAAPTNK